MHTGPTSNKKPTESANYSAGHTDNHILPTDKDFATLAARFALTGHTLTRSITPEGKVFYHASRWGMSRSMPNVEAAEQFLAQIGASK
jgi:hypothetical protein